ncbi:UNVERIFIED_CONTAM: hypothetical protein HHA_308970 [Hammondia hammondi]|eukprot:XP_008888109.1 hypothetical protein HHA_308970 [Hammondia hammondi]
MILRHLVALGTASVLLVLFSSAAGPVSGLVGKQESGCHISVRQGLPAGAWKKVRDGGCLVGLASNLVVDPAFPNIVETLDVPHFIGGQLCDWLDVQWLKHTTVAKDVFKAPTGVLKFMKRQSEFRFEDSLEVVIIYIDLVDYQHVHGIRGHVPIPWGTATFRYRPPTHDFGESVVSFVARGGPPYSPTKVHFLLVPEISRRLRLDTGYTPGHVSADVVVSDKINEGTELDFDAEQPLLLRSFLIFNGACTFLDGRLQTTDLELCHWAENWGKFYTSSSAIMQMHRLALFNSYPAGFVATMELRSPEYSRYDKFVHVLLKPNTQLAGIFQDSHDSVIRRYREL